MTVHEGMLINQGTEKHNKYQTLGRFPELTSVQRAFPNLFPRAGVIGKLRGGQYTVRTKLSSSWKGCGTQEGAGEREQVTLREGTVLFREGKEKLMGEQLERRESNRRLDLGL